MFLTSRSRGQTLPIWSMGIAAALVLAFAAVQYGEVLRWQVRAQSAADAAASAALSVQTQTWNQQLSLLYAAEIEEWRIRGLLSGLQAAAFNDPGCANGNCQATYDTLRRQYNRAVERYRVDMDLINRTSQYTFGQAQSDAKAIVAGLQQNCGQVNGGDCAFSYSVVSVVPRAGVLNDVEESAGLWAVNTGTPATVKQDLMPAQIEVVTCAKIKPVVPGFLNFQPPAFTAIGRAAATSAMVTQEWIQPGVIDDPITNAPFQPDETYGLTGTRATGPDNGAGPWNWFTVSFAGNPAHAYPYYDAYSVRANGPEFEAATGWWNAIPIRPFSGTLDANTVPCAS